MGDILRDAVRFLRSLTFGVKVNFLSVLGLGTRDLWDTHAPVVVPIT